MVNVMRKVSKK